MAKSGKLIQKNISKIKKRGTNGYRKVNTFTQKRPLQSVFLLLIILFLIILIGQKIRTPKQNIVKSDAEKKVGIYKIGNVPSLEFQGQVKKTGVITIFAQTPGIVSNIYTKTGNTIYKGKTILSLSNNYTGGNISSSQRKLADLSYQHAKDTYEESKEIINKQRDLAEKVDSNSDELRDITSKSVNDTGSLIKLNEDILNSINSSLSSLEASNTGGVNDQAIFTTKQTKAQYESVLAGLKTQQRNNEYTSNGDKNPAEISNIQKDLALKQLDIQQKALDLSIKTSKIQSTIARIGESMMYPASPSNGTVEKIHVKVGDFVNPGTPLATITSNSISSELTVLVPESIASQVNILQPSSITRDQESFSLLPKYISKEPTNGNLHSITYDLPESLNEKFSDSDYVSILIPVGSNSSKQQINIPIDTVHQTQSGAFVYVLQGSKAVVKKVILGTVSGDFVEIKSGLNVQDEIIIDRNVLNGETVKR